MPIYTDLLGLTATENQTGMQLLAGEYQTITVGTNGTLDAELSFASNPIPSSGISYIYLARNPFTPGSGDWRVTGAFGPLLGTPFGDSGDFDSGLGVPGGTYEVVNGFHVTTAAGGNIIVETDPSLVTQPAIKRLRSDLVSPARAGFRTTNTPAVHKWEFPRSNTWGMACASFLTPTLTGLAPSSGLEAGGESIVISGTDFDFSFNGAAGFTFVVKFGGVASSSKVILTGHTANNFTSVPTTLRATAPAGTGTVDVVVEFHYPDGVTVDTLTLPASYTYIRLTYALDWSAEGVLFPPTTTPDGTITTPATPFKGFTTGDEPFQLFSFTTPIQDFIVISPFFWNGTYFPAGTRIHWVVTADPGDKGWWLSHNDIFQGASYVMANSRPKNPRGFTEF